MKQLYVLPAALAAVAAVAAGCGEAIPSSNGGHAAVGLASAKIGRFLVDQKGHSLYLFEKDDKGESYCTGACASVWPPFETDSMPKAMNGASASALGTIKRSDGEMQVTYNGHPLYFYAADASKPGKTKGEDLEQFGSGWYLLSASGKPLEGGHGGSGGSSGSGGYGGSGGSSGSGGSGGSSGSGGSGGYGGGGS